MESIEPIRLWQKYRIYILLIFILIVLSPVIFNGNPLHYFSPDLEYVKGKLLYVMDGDLYGDPITGFPNMHPPIYHLFLALPTFIGIPIDTTLLLVTISNVLLIFFFIFRIIRKLFDTDTAVITCLLFPFIIEYMGCGYLFLATALCFSIPFYLAGTYLYLTHKRTLSSIILLSALWGMAFLITPVYVFLIGYALIYELLFRRDLKFFAISSTTIAIMLIPFFYQIYVISSFKLFGTSAFSFWRGLPDLPFLKTIGERIVSPTGHLFTEPLVWTAPLIIIGGFVAVWKIGRGQRYYIPTCFVIIASLSHLSTSYHFAPQYATRVYLFLSIFLVAFGVSYLIQSRIKAAVKIALISIFVTFGTVGFMDRVLTVYETQSDSLENVGKIHDNFSKALARIVPPGSFIWARARVYRLYILPYHLLHGLKAYSSGEYYQLSSELSQDFQNDYKDAFACTNAECLDPICDKYGIEYAVIHAGDFKFRVFKIIDRNWDLVYRDNYFAIFKRR